MKRIVVVFVALLSIAAAHAQGYKGQHGEGHKAGRHGHGMMMRHANPLPNLMKVIRKRGAELDLNEAQSRALEDWRTRHGEPMHALVAQIGEMEKALNEAAMAGRPKAELMVLNARILAARERVVSTKIDCRDNMRRVLSPAQYEKVLALYADMQSRS